MSEFDPELPSGASTDTAEVTTADAKDPLWKRILFGAFVTFAVLFFAAAVLYKFGSMWVPSAETRAEYEALRTTGAAPEIERRFHIPIPGCVCHSDDPVLTMQHSTRRVSECMGCHGG